LNKSPWKIIGTWFYIIWFASWGVAGIMIDEDNRVEQVLFYIIVIIVGLFIEGYIQKKEQQYQEREEWYRKHLPKVKCPKCGKIWDDWAYEYEGCFCDCGEKLMIKKEDK